MKYWILVAVAGMLVATYVFLYIVGSTETSGWSVGLANSVGLIAVVIGLLAAGILLRRATPLR